ncbi:MAG: aminotransferase class V-fold PLP-dependent enzyme [Clostridia bacterium]|nr:aminotransferase class V-fold PLP-dependent enzyme [Clostridia bacterium]
MIYLDNAATMFPRPDCVKDAVLHALDMAGNPGRSAHEAAFAADEMMEQTRQSLCRLFHAEEDYACVFAQNATDALNMAIPGSLNEGDHAVTTMMEHNSVLRPLYALQKTRNVELTIVPPDEMGIIRPAQIEKALQKNTKLVIVTHVSNVTGAIMPVQEIINVCRRHGIPCLIDASQAAGHMAVDLQSLQADLVAMPGHKGLCGPQGTGVLFVKNGTDLSPTRFGGTGILTFSQEMPQEYPSHLEAGTQNVHGIAGLGAGVRMLQEKGVENIAAHEKELTEHLLSELTNFPDVVIYSPQDAAYRSGVVSFNIASIDPSHIANALAQEHICVRAGFHCAPLAHKCMNTTHCGAVRVSFSMFNTHDEVDSFLSTLRRIIR